MDGHKVEGCKGKWIHIGTLVRPRMERCAECRGVRDRPPGDEPGDVEVVDMKRRRYEGLERLKQEVEEQELTPDEMTELNAWIQSQKTAGGMSTYAKWGIALLAVAGVGVAVVRVLELWGRAS
jgi:hypothetical protein